MSENDAIDYIEIDHNNSISFIDLQQVYFKLFKLKEKYSEKLISSDISQFIGKLLPSSNKDNFTISNAIKKQYLKEVNISKPEVEICINYFESHRIEGSTTFVLSKENIQNLGNLIAYGYKKFDCFKTKSEKDLVEKVNQIKQNDIDVIADYNRYREKEKNPKKIVEKTEYLRKHRSNYPLPPEFIYALHYCKIFTKVEICLESYKNNDLRLLMLIYLNFEKVFHNVKEIKVDFSNETCLQLIYERLQFHLNKRENQKGRFVKKINYRDEFSRKHRWNFTSDYITSCEDETLPLASSLKSEKDSSLISKQSVDSNSDQKQILKTLDIIKNDQFLFEAILITPFFLTKYTKITNITLIFSDFFNREFKWLFQDIYNLNINNFHMLNTFTSQLVKLETFNVEFNSLSPQGFEKIIAIIDKNENLSTLRMSLFNSDVNYRSAGL